MGPTFGGMLLSGQKAGELAVASFQPVEEGSDPFFIGER